MGTLPCGSHLLQPWARSVGKANQKCLIVTFLNSLWYSHVCAFFMNDCRLQVVKSLQISTYQCLTKIFCKYESSLSCFRKENSSKKICQKCRDGKESWEKLLEKQEPCCGSGTRIRCLFDPWIRDPGWVKSKDPDQGWTTRIIFPRA